MTIVLLLWLEEFQAEKKNSWMLIGKKAEEWLAKQGAFVINEYQHLKKKLFF